MAGKATNGEDVHLQVAEQDGMELDDVQNGVKNRHPDDPEVDHRGGGFPEVLLGRMATQIGSMVICIAVTVIGLILTVVVAVQGTAVHATGSTIFFMVCYFISIVFILMVLVWGCRDTMNPDPHAKWKQANSIDFLKAGALVLGAGSIIYHMLLIVEWMEKPVDCQNTFELLYYVMSVGFPLAQTYMIILYSKAEISGSWWKEALSRLMFALTMACNLCVWYQTLIFESQHAVMQEINKSKAKNESGGGGGGDHGGSDSQASSYDSHASALTGHETTTAGHYDNTTHQDTGHHEDEEHHDCGHGYSPYSNTFSPYLYPCTIEYSITCACIIFMMWIRVGGDQRKDSKSDLPDPEHVKEDHAGENHLDHEIRPIVVKAENPNFNPRCGLFWSLVVICATLIVVIVYLFSEYKDNEVRLSSSILIFALDIKWNLISMILVPLVLLKMKNMDLKDSTLRMKRFHKEGRSDRKPKSGVAHHRRNMDKAMLIIAYVGLFVFSILTMIATGAQGEWLLFFESLLSIFSGLALTLAVCLKLMAKRSTTPDHLRTRPGKQLLEAIRGFSLALWVLQTFAIRRNSAHKVQIEFYGLVPWSMVSHIFMPLAILFRFHAAVVISDVIKASYTGKYVL